MLLVDSSVWIDHLRSNLRGLASALEDQLVLTHPFVLGELACGNISNRKEIMMLLRDLPSAKLASDGEALAFIERQRLMGKGLGYIDVHLLASALLTGVSLWTRDRRLAAVAAELGVQGAATE